MPVDFLDSPNVGQRARELGFDPPKGIAILPRNYFEASSASELVHDRDAITIRKLWKQQGIEETALDPQVKSFPSLLERSASWIAPVIFVSAMMASQNPSAVSVALNVVANYVTEFFRGNVTERGVRLDVIVETEPDKTYKRVSYKGPVEGLAELKEAVEELLDGD